MVIWQDIKPMTQMEFEKLKFTIYADMFAHDAIASIFSAGTDVTNESPTRFVLRSGDQHLLVHGEGFEFSLTTGVPVKGSIEKIEIYNRALPPGEQLQVRLDRFNSAGTPSMLSSAAFLGELLDLFAANPGKALAKLGEDLDLTGSGFNVFGIVNGAGFVGTSITDAINVIGSTGSMVHGAGGDDSLYDGRGNDTLIGGSGDDFFHTFQGNDLVFGGPGDDLIIAETYNSPAIRFHSFNGGTASEIRGGDGNDTIRVGDGHRSDTQDTVFGGAGDDQIRVIKGTNTVFGGDGNDHVTIEVGRERGANTVQGNQGDDTISTGKGNDLVSGGFGNDEIRTSDGDDVLSGNPGDDVLQAGGGQDALSGGAGDDTLRGGDGDDTLDGGAGDDHALGGAGADRFVFGLHDERFTVGDFSQGVDVMALDADLFQGLDLSRPADALSAVGDVIGGNLVLAFASGDTLIVSGVADLAAFSNDVVFV